MKRKKLLLLHGALGSSRQFRKLRPLLADAFDVNTFNFSGHGGMAITEDFSIDLFAQNVLEFLGSESTERINIFGYSMGGYAALKAALCEPEKIHAIVTLGTKFNWEVESADKEIRMLNPDKIEEKVPHFAEKLSNEHAPANWKQVVSQTASMMHRLAHGEKLVSTDLEKIPTEVVIGIGAEDNMVSLEESEEVARTLPNGTLVKLPGVHHPIEKNKPEQLSAFIKNAFSISAS